jgi:hypothetical protein
MSTENFNKKVLIVAPFWQKPGNVGNYRVERFIRWLKTDGYSIYVLRAGKKNEVQKKEWGIELVKKDYILIITEILRRVSDKKILKIIWYAWLTFILKFSPVDEFFIWANGIFSGFDFQKYFRDIDLVISTSPPNSSHLAADKISNKYSIPLIVDLRDGWLDEPFEQKLNKFKRLKKLEAEWEYKILNHALGIFVTSVNWKNLLISRIPSVNKKVNVLTNAYPEVDFINPPRPNHSLDKVILLYSGRIGASDISRNLNSLLDPIYNYLKNNLYNIEILFISEFRREEVKSFQIWKKEFQEINIRLTHKSHVKRIELYKEIMKYQGLLLLTTKMGTIPIKLFDYIKSTKPILAITPRGSAIWQLSEILPQLFLYEYSGIIKDYSPIKNFLEACKMKNYEYNIPIEFTEEFLLKIFLKEVKHSSAQVKI